MAALQEYEKPDGTIVRLPSQLAASFSQSLKPVQPAAPPMPGMTDLAPLPPGAPAEASPAQRPELPMSPGGPVPPPAVDTSLLQSPPVMPAPMDEPTFAEAVTGIARPIPGATGPAVPAVPVAPSAPAAPSAPVAPTTARDLRAGGPGAIYDRQTTALDEARSAGAMEIANAGELARQKADAEEAHLQRQDALDRQRMVDAEKRMAEMAAQSALRVSAIDKLANSKIDASIQHPILAGIAVALSAFGQGMNGDHGPNAAMGVLMKQIDNNVNRQLAEREKQGKVISLYGEHLAGLRQQFTDQGALHDALRAAELQRYKSTMNIVAERSGSKDTQAKLLKLSSDIGLKGAEALSSAQDKQNAFDDKERAFKEQQAARAQAAQQHRASLGVQYAGLAQSDRHFKERLAFDKNKETNDVNAELMKLAQAGKVADAKLLKERGISGSREVEREPVLDEKGQPKLDDQGRPVLGPIKTGPDGRPIVKYGFLKNRDGTPFVPQGSDTAVDKLRNQQAAAQRLVNILDQVKAEGHEWLSDTANSEKKQRIKTLWGEATLVAKDSLDLGAIQGADMELIINYLGTDDPTKFRDATAGMTQARKNIVAGMTTKLQTYGLDGEWSPTDLAALNRPIASPEDKSAQRVLESPTKLTSAAAELGLDRAGVTPQQIADKLYEAGGMLPSQRATMDVYARGAASSDPKARERALTWLERAANTAQAPAIREYASSLLQSNASRQVETSPLPREEPAARVK
jgi:hypothetical protein